jgi:hypothetical protein
LPGIEFAIAFRHPRPDAIADDEDEENTPSNGNKQEVTEDVDAGELSRGRKEEVTETPKMSRRRIGGERVRGAGGRIIDSPSQEALCRTELDTASEATATIHMPKKRYHGSFSYLLCIHAFRVFPF